MSDRVMPHDADAEAAVLGAMMISPSAAIDCATALTGEDFYVPKHELIFDAATSLLAHGEPVDALTVTDELIKTGELQRAGGADYVHTLTDMVPTATNAGYYVGIVRDRAVRRRLVEAGGRIHNAGFSGSGNVMDLVEQAREELDAVAAERKQQVRFAGDAFEELIEQLDSKQTFVPSPWWSLNEIIGGFRPGAVYVVGARPGEGKSVLATQIARCLAENGTVAMSSLEMSRTELVARMVSDIAGVHVTHLKDNKLTSHDWEQIRRSREEIAALQVAIDDRTNVTAMDVRAHAAEVARKGTLAGVVVDYLQLMSGRSSLDRHLQVAEFSRQLKILAKDLRIPVIVLSQLNRELEKRASRRPALSDLRESGAIEQDADVVMLLHRRSCEDCDHPAHLGQTVRRDGARIYVDELVVDVAKNRHGRAAEAHLRWEGEYSRALDWTEQS